MRHAVGATTQPVLQPVGQLVRTRLLGVHDDEGVAHPDLGRRRPGLRHMLCRRMGDPHLAADVREPGPLEGRRDLRPDVPERLGVDIARRPYLDAAESHVPHLPL